MSALLSKLNVNTVLSLLTLVVGLAVTDSVISGTTGKLITGTVSGLVSLGLLVYNAVKESSKAKVATAQVSAGQATTYKVD